MVVWLRLRLPFQRGSELGHFGWAMESQSRAREGCRQVILHDALCEPGGRVDVLMDDGETSSWRMAERRRVVRYWGLDRSSG